MARKPARASVSRSGEGEYMNGQRKLFNPIFESTGAQFSEDRKYRYALWRQWKYVGHSNCVMFVGLNPSTADENDNDMTITKCIGFAKKWGYGGIYMLNLFGFCATNPLSMIAADDPIGRENDEAFGYYRIKVGLIVAAWGSMELRYRPRMQWQSRISQVLSAIGRPVWCLGKTRDGSPHHPSRLSYAVDREPFWSPSI